MTSKRRWRRRVLWLKKRTAVNNVRFFHYLCSGVGALAFHYPPSIRHSPCFFRTGRADERSMHSLEGASLFYHNASWLPMPRPPLDKSCRQPVNKAMRMASESCRVSLNSSDKRRAIFCNMPVKMSCPTRGVMKQGWAKTVKAVPTQRSTALH